MAERETENREGNGRRERLACRSCTNRRRRPVAEGQGGGWLEGVLRVCPGTLVAPQADEIDVVVLHGTEAWAQAWLRGAGAGNGGRAESWWCCRNRPPRGGHPPASGGGRRGARDHRRRRAMRARSRSTSPCPRGHPGRRNERPRSHAPRRAKAARVPARLPGPNRHLEGDPRQGIRRHAPVRNLAGARTCLSAAAPARVGRRPADRAGGRLPSRGSAGGGGSGTAARRS